MKKRIVTSLLATSFAFAATTVVVHAEAINNEAVVAEAESEVVSEETVSSEEAAIDEDASEEIVSEEAAIDEDTNEEVISEEVVAEETQDQKVAAEVATDEAAYNEDSSEDAQVEVWEYSESDENIDRFNEMMDRVRQLHEKLAMIGIEDIELREQGMGVRQIKYNGEYIVQVEPYDRSRYEMINATDSWSYDLENHSLVSFDMYYYNDGEDPLNNDISVGVFKDFVINKLAYLMVSSDKVELAGGIKMGASVEDVKAVYGEPDEVKTDSSCDYLIYVNGDNRSEFSFVEGKLDYIELVNKSLYEEYDDKNDLLEISYDVMSPLYGKALNTGVTPDSYKKQLNEVLARVSVPANYVGGWGRQFANDEIDPEILAQIMARVNELEAEQASEDAETDIEAEAGDEAAEDLFDFEILSYNGKPLVAPSTSEDARYDFINYNEQNSWDYELKDYPGVKYEMFYYTDGPGIEGKDITVGIFNENGIKRLAYLDFKADAVEFPDGTTFKITTDYVLNKLGNPDEAKANDNGGEHWIYNVPKGTMEFNVNNGLVESSKLINEECFAKYDDVNDLKAISQDPIALYYGSKLSIGITPDLYKELSKMGWM
ncbi:MAG: hypothetical protein K6D38_07360 [Pseudobutyrivibrio sp.]|nr:hypothetical protein [Pseudobutyrivibrio sp.]